MPEFSSNFQLCQGLLASLTLYEFADLCVLLWIQGFCSALVNAYKNRQANRMLIASMFIDGVHNNLIDVLEIHYSRSNLYGQYAANSKALCRSSDLATHFTKTVVLIKVTKNLAASQPQRLSGAFSDHPIGDCSP